MTHPLTELLLVLLLKARRGALAQRLLLLLDRRAALGLPVCRLCRSCSFAGASQDQGCHVQDTYFGVQHAPQSVPQNFQQVSFQAELSGPQSKTTSPGGLYDGV